MISIRTGKPSDLDTLFAFQLAMAAESEDIALDQDKLRLGLRTVLASVELGTYYLAEESGEPLGCLLVTREWSDWRNGHVWWIQSVYVPPAHRKRGIYRQLYTHLQELAREDETVVGIRLYVEKDNIRARDVYKKLGMNEERYLVCEWLKTDH
ncbi:MAG TPA: GNAT family N-acetyltransferase [Bdellovibrionota bacterium]|jgi:ribosomal protein S18 acetylase RimI-like enzyme|nr:GNAT family N-acetyltransferase [Bdellovibrionota bacterium]